MKSKRIVSILICLFIALNLAACTTKLEEPPLVIPEGYTQIDSEETAAKDPFIGFGAQMEAYWFPMNVWDLRHGYDVKDSDWDNIFLPRIQKMKLSTVTMGILTNMYHMGVDQYDYDTVWMRGMKRMLQDLKDSNVLVTLDLFGTTMNVQGGTGIYENAWMGRPSSTASAWLTPPLEQYEDEFIEGFVDVVHYLIVEQGFTNINKLILFSEPTATFMAYGGFDYYAKLCRKIHEKLIEKGIRDRLILNLSDDAGHHDWLFNTINLLGDVADMVNTHSYYYGYNQTNEYIQSQIETFTMGVEGTDLPIAYGEYGTLKVSGAMYAADRFDFERGVEIPRIGINMLNAGACGANYWILFSEFFSTDDFTISDDPDKNKIMNMGLWGFKDEEYACRPVYYAWTLMTRYTEIGSKIYHVPLKKEGITLTMLQTPENKWTYLISNVNEQAEKIAIVNRGISLEDLQDGLEFDKYVYEEGALPENGVDALIQSSGKVVSEGRVTSLEVPAYSFVVLSNLE